MRLNADFTQPVHVQCAGMPWTPSPVAGVERRMLDRVGDEVARATSLVRYAPGSQFAAHVHSGGEEFLVLEGVFQDQHGDYPAGTYVRNPPGSAHVPASAQGCVIFVKLWQFDPADQMPVVGTAADRVWQADAVDGGLRTAFLHRDARETVMLEAWAPERQAALGLPGGAEFLVLEGTLQVAWSGPDGQASAPLPAAAAASRGSGWALQALDWLRVPAASRLHLQAGPDGCRLWCKTGHLARPVAI